MSDFIDCKMCNIFYNGLTPCEECSILKELKIGESVARKAGSRHCWICPVCGRGHSPFIDTCDCVKN